MKLVEISGLIEQGMWNYGDELGLPIFSGPKITQLASVEKDGFSAHKIEFSILTGTYLETPAHLLEDARTIDELDLKELFLPASVIKLNKKPNSSITKDDITKSGVIIKKGDCLVVFTGWYKMWNKKNFVLDCPYFDSECMDYIVSREIKVLASDTPCYDDIRDPVDSKKLPQLRKLYLSGAMALAPIVNGDRAKQGRAKIIILPLKVKNLSASPARAVLIYR
ncbi:MAG: cyclase family protein [Candidatus Omnitrophica bacterium]|nr:cyclase family protein [Candidatus Omnitrophota bacterium]MCM8816187.1 cyclase family protein [Candidatus Omnitrophota bacterium]